VEEDPEHAENEQWEAVALTASGNAFVANERHQQEVEPQRRRDANAWRREAQ
jgi:hypothetical protein